MMNTKNVSYLGVIIVFVTMIINPSMGFVKANNDYGVIIDAGSSGSRVYVYYWRHREDKSRLPDVYPVVGDGLGQMNSKDYNLVYGERFITDAVQAGSSYSFVISIISLKSLY